MADYTDTTHKTVGLGGLRFEVTHRSLGEDGGPTIAVYGGVDGKDVQVLRFDCFRKDPHYHMPPGSKDSLHLDPASVGDGLEWSLTQIKEHVPEMLATAGFFDLSKSVDRDALRSGWTQVKDAVAETAPA